jgi:hypothetical protein
MPVNFLDIIAKLAEEKQRPKRVTRESAVSSKRQQEEIDNIDDLPPVILSADELEGCERRVEQFLLMRPSNKDWHAAEQFLYPDFPAGRLEYTDEESAAITELAYALQRRRHTGQA